MLKKDKAVCIRAKDYSETSQIVTFFTSENGKISAIAKGSKRSKSAFDGPIEVFARGQIVFAESEKAKLATLTEFQQQPIFENLMKDIFAQNACLFASELIDSLTDEHDAHPRIFDFFVHFLEDVNALEVTIEHRRDILALVILFQLSLLKESGLQPVLNYCPNCKTRYLPDNTQYELYFSSEANGLICRDCEANFPDKIRATKSAGEVLYNIKKLVAVKETVLREVEKLLIGHFSNIIGRPPRMAKYILDAR
ncbi:MAG: DNA repair protein RecO [Phycisphaerae bacterium]